MAKKRKLYLQVELEVLDLVDPIGGMAGQRPGDVMLGLLKLWRYCWLRGLEVVLNEVAEGFVPGGVPALLAFGFLTRVDAQSVRVDGADRYEKVKNARAAGARATNAILGRSANAQRPESDENGRSASGDTERLRDRETEKDDSAPRLLSKWEALWSNMSDLRAERLEQLGLTPSVQQALPASRVNTLLKRAASQTLAMISEPSDDGSENIAALWKRYLMSEYWSTRSPPFPLEGFCAPKTLQACVEMWGSKSDPVNTGAVWS